MRRPALTPAVGRRGWFVLIATILTGLTGCGQTGPLTLPDRSEPAAGLPAASGTEGGEDAATDERERDDETDGSNDR